MGRALVEIAVVIADGPTTLKAERFERHVRFARGRLTIRRARSWKRAVGAGGVAPDGRAGGGLGELNPR